MSLKAFKNLFLNFVPVNYKDNLEDFVEEYKNTEQKFLENNKSYSGGDQGEVWLSCEPWFNFTGLISVYDKNIAIPQVIWDRFQLEDGKCYLHFSIMFHHGFVDGSHLGAFIRNLEEMIDNIEDEYGEKSSDGYKKCYTIKRN